MNGIEDKTMQKNGIRVVAAIVAISGFSSAWAQSGPAMDHGGMNMQAAADATDAQDTQDRRDPHAYADGFTLDSGKYALPGPRQLSLADEHSFGSLLVDRLEHAQVTRGGPSGTAYDMQAWFGRDYDRLVIKAEGEHANGRLQEARTELLWGHAVASYWDTQLGVRQDSGLGPGRTWLAFGVQGMAPYWFEVDATAYVGSDGRTALRLGAEYEMSFTQRLILQPRGEFNFYGKRDVAHDIGSGLADGVLGLRLRYEISRQFAPYLGVERTAKFGQTADIARAVGEPTGETRWVAGLRFWF
ncbi:MAG: copper resistance protein B [Gammaproteobacteria bacterium]|nr:copper resistance protein B [Gammaproteobacteria bacterium]MBU1646490.1 copper resistance protein B [Gammaproteobacteria bacterium]MBU1971033.1 copper resistance protein B [Gammaproteobacteria bacterium]